MPFDTISPKTMSLVVDGKTIEIKNQKRQNGALNRSLLSEANWKAFVADPKGYAAKYDLTIDDTIAGQLRDQLKDVGSLEEATTIFDRLGWRATTVWAVVAGAYSTASTKVAVAFRGGMDPGRIR